MCSPHDQDAPTLNDIALAVDRAWNAIAFDIHSDSVSAAEMLELAVDADRLTMYGNDPAAATEAYRLIQKFGWNKFEATMLKILPYDHYEAGGAQ